MRQSIDILQDVPAQERQKLMELVLYIARRSQFDRHFGRTKLNKILFHSEFRCMQQTGRAITGARYRRLGRGPVLRALLPILAEIKESGAGAEETVAGAGWEQVRLHALRPADLDLFSSVEISIVNEILDELRDSNATEVSDASHTHRGWMLVGHGEDIPYSAAFAADGPPELTDEEIAFGQALVAAD